MNRIDLVDRVAAVTGSAQGIGRAVAERLLASGAAVALWDMDAELLEQTRSELAAQGRVTAITMDVTDLASAEEALAETKKQLGGLDILVNNAGIAGPTVKTWDYPAAEWQKVIDIDLTGVFFCCRAAVPTMIGQNYGRIVSVASIAGKEGQPQRLGL